MSCNVIAALLLCNLSWMAASASESQTVEVQHGQDVTLLCTKISDSYTLSVWFRLVNKSKPSCISSLFRTVDTASFCDGFQNEKFEMTANASTIFLEVKQVDLSDSGLYFCGLYEPGSMVIVNATYLKVQGNSEFEDEVDVKCIKEPDEITIWTCGILGGVILILIMIIVGLVLKIKQLQRAVNEELQPQGNKNLDSGDLTYAALSFNPKAKRSRRPASEKEVETTVVYAATR